MKRATVHVAGIVLLLVGSWLGAQPAEDPLLDPGRHLAIVPITGQISDVTFESLQRRVGEAREAGVELVVLEMDTPGGQVSSAFDICTYLKQLDIDTVAWVRPDAYSAGAMISLACDRIVMSPRSRIGDSAPIMIGPGGGMQEMGEVERAKSVSPILEEFRDSARRNGYSETLCEAMVRLGPAIYMIRREQTGEVRYVWADELRRYGLAPPATNAAADVPDDQAPVPTAAVESGWQIDRVVNPANTLLTLSQDEAVTYGFAERIIADETELAAYLGASEVSRFESTWSEDLVGWITSPAVRGVLLLVVIVGFYMEMQTPGLGIAGLAALVALVIMVGAPFLTGLAGVLDITLIALGLILLLVELLVLPGFGVPGLAGLALMFIGLVMTFVQSEPGPGWWPELPGTWAMIRQGLITVVAAMFVATLVMIWLTRHFGALPIFNRLVLADEQSAASSVRGTVSSDTPTDAAVAIGAVGRTVTVLRPVGRAEIDGQVVDVITDGAWVQAGRNVRVVEASGNRVVVEEVA